MFFLYDLIYIYLVIDLCVFSSSSSSISSSSSSSSF